MVNLARSLVASTLVVMSFLASSCGSASEEARADYTVAVNWDADGKRFDVAVTVDRRYGRACDESERRRVTISIESSGFSNVGDSFVLAGPKIEGADEGADPSEIYATSEDSTAFGFTAYNQKGTATYTFRGNGTFGESLIKAWALVSCDSTIE